MKSTQMKRQSYFTRSRQRRRNKRKSDRRERLRISWRDGTLVAGKEAGVKEAKMVTEGKIKRR